MIKKSKIAIFLFLALIFLLVLVSLDREKGLGSYSELSSVNVGGVSVEVEVVQTRHERMVGLSGRESLGSGSGMFFVFGQAGRHGIWMPDMNFPIDILWIDRVSLGDKKESTAYFIVDIAHDVSPESYPEVFYPDFEARYVLEVNAGFARENNINIGDQVELLK